jgi:hypothetical protein
MKYVPSSKMVEPFLPRILDCIRGNLNNKKQFCFESVTCLSQLSVVLDNQVIPSSEWDDLLR